MVSSHLDRLKDADEKIFNAPSTSEAEKLRGSLHVNLFMFALFLYIQQINKISLRASAVSANAEWPGSHIRSSELDSGRSTPIRPSRNLDEQCHLQFVSENLHEILDLLVEPIAYSGTAAEPTLSEDAVEALNLILEGSIDQGRSLNSFSELVHMPSILSSTGYSKNSRSFHLRTLHSWIRSWITANPFSVENCIRTGRRLQWRLPHQVLVNSGSGNILLQQQQNIFKRQKIATNAHQVPKTGGRNGNKLVVMSMISRQIIARSSATLDGSTLKVHRAHSSYLYLLSPMRCVTLDKCRKLTIVLGPIENTLQLNHCEDCLIIAACRRIVLTACRGCTLHLAVQSRPIFIQPPLASSGSLGIATNGGQTTPNTPTPGPSALMGNEEIILAPFHTIYMRLVEHLNRANLSTKVNYWDQPFLLGQDSSKSDLSSHPSGIHTTDGGRCWDILRPEHFYPFNIPLLLPSRTDNLNRNLLPTEDAENEDSGRRSSSSSYVLDLSATLVTDTARFFNESGEIRLDSYINMANTRLPIPLPKAYLIALSERATLYQKWPQHIASAKLSPDQRHLFGMLVDQVFRRWLVESGNLRQLQFLELSTGHVTAPHINNGSGQTNTPPITGSITNGEQVSQTVRQFQVNRTINRRPDSRTRTYTVENRPPLNETIS